MNAEKILSDLEQQDVTVSVDGEQLRVEAPRGTLTEELRRTLSEHKPDIVELIRGRSMLSDHVSSEEPTETVRVAAMKLDDFASAGLIVQVRSEVLGADVLFVSDNVPESKLESRPEVVYRAHELKKLARMPPDAAELRDVHMVKEIYGGTIEGVKHRTEEDQPEEVGHAAKG